MDLYVEIKKRLPGFYLDIKFEGTKEKIALLGASGSGKSMTLRCIAGLVTPDEGRIIINGKTYFDSKTGINIKPKDRKIGFLFQNYALFPHLTVSENIAFGLSGLSNFDKNLKVTQMVKKFQLTGIESSYPEQISGGQQQRTALARTLATEPEILLLDEPFSALDEYLRSHMIKETLKILNEFNGSTLFVTHNIEEAYRLCDILAVLSGGLLHSYGYKKEVFENPMTLQAARVTGCKNIVEAVRVDDEHIEIPLWNIMLKTTSKTKAKEGFCAIRANHIKLFEADYSDNVLEARIVGNIETPFRQTVYLKFEKGLNDHCDYHIQWEVSKDTWDKISKEPEKLSICIPMDKIIYF